MNHTAQHPESHMVGQPARLSLVGGFAGSGKSEFGRFLSTMTGWALLDKDTLTRPFAEALLLSLGSDVNDRHTALYREKIRPLEYRAVINTALQNLDCGVSTVVTAPFISEIVDEPWLTRLKNQCAARDGEVTVVWVECDEESMYDYLSFRGAARDAWKLECWDDYLATIDLSLHPRCAHFVVDNRLNATVSMAEQCPGSAGPADRTRLASGTQPTRRDVGATTVIEATGPCGRRYILRLHRHPERPPCVEVHLPCSACVVR
ncbi:MAG: AAA family ATPase [Pseudonocardiaceae bacterium]